MSTRETTWLSNDMDRVEKLLQDTAGASSHPLVSEACLHLIKAGGKRVRPALVLLASHAGGAGAGTTDLSAAAVELVHLATLYHDDVMDQSETRRGVPTAHSKWGTEVAVLAGDYLFACGCALGADAGGEVPGILARAIARVCEGQIVETASLNDPHRSVDDYLDTISLKTAALFRASCELGATTSGASEVDRRALVTYGEKLGLAFQVVDDLLDLLGDPASTGKRPGTDLKAGVFTAPVLIACNRDPSLAGRLSSGRRELDDVLPTLISTGALGSATDLAHRFRTEALDELTLLDPGAWRDSLEDLVESVLGQIPRVPAA
ncbi:MAG: polyprenyl synthetase family protein [Actinomycetota bacterium]|jgi:heptaprenyl diphosphate synthase